MSIELPVATRHRRDMTKKLLKATLNPNSQTHTHIANDKNFSWGQGSPNRFWLVSRLPLKKSLICRCPISLAAVKRSVTCFGASIPVAKLERSTHLSSVTDSSSNSNGLAINSEVKRTRSLFMSSSSRLMRLSEQSL